jgi:acetyl-CoA synthetase
MLRNGRNDDRNYEQVYNEFRWQIPEHYNIGVDVCDKWASVDPNKLALIFVDADGVSREYNFGELRDESNRLANLLAAHGIGKGDRVGILLTQSPEAAFSHIAVPKLGAIAVPLFVLFGVDALSHRLADSGACAVITDAQGAAKLAEIRAVLPDLKLILSVGGGPGTIDFYPALESCGNTFEPVRTRAEDPAMIIYTSGTTGAPKGALHAHRVLLGHLPGVEMSHDFFPQPGDRIWTPADWAWIGGLLDVLLPALHHGVPVVARRFAKFTGEAAFDLIRDYDIRNAFIPPTALKVMRSVPHAEDRWPLKMRTVASGGESLGTELLEWGRRTLGVTINEFYGQTECNMVVSSCGALMAPRPGVMGKAVPGHQVEVIDAAGRPSSMGELGIVGVRRGDPVMFLRYWNNPDETAVKFSGDWLLTGDTAVKEGDSWIRFVGRTDDMITSAGYRIGPSEIEDCLLRHPAVKLACAVGKPDPQRTQVVKIYVVLRDGYTASDKLATEIAAHVKTRLAAHEYPREVEFVSSLPMTATGKLIRRELRERAEEEARTEDSKLSGNRGNRNLA